MGYILVGLIDSSCSKGRQHALKRRRVSASTFPIRALLSAVTKDESDWRYIYRVNDEI